MAMLEVVGIKREDSSLDEGVGHAIETEAAAPCLFLSYLGSAPIATQASYDFDHRASTITSPCHELHLGPGTCPVGVPGGSWWDSGTMGDQEKSSRETFQDRQAELPGRP
jgi:hypothetical protein